jgi:hypothetical protein
MARVNGTSVRKVVSRCQAIYSRHWLTIQWHLRRIGWAPSGSESCGERVLRWETLSTARSAMYRRFFSTHWTFLGRR